MDSQKPTPNNSQLPESRKGEKRPDINRSSRHQLKLRIDYTVELLMNDMSSTDIVKILTTKYAPLSSRQALRYYYIAFASLQQKDNINKARKKAWYYARKLRLIRDMDPKAKRSPQGTAVINDILDSLAAMDGIETKILKIRGDRENPVEINHTHTHVAKPSIDYERMPTELLESYIRIHEETQKYLTSRGDNNIEDAQIVPE
ncbi:MAG TPA: hypothetical protein PLU07_09295 [Ferruginibacter sp.]|nr:hypothetical protein [Ferruginibacter sp.]